MKKIGTTTYKLELPNDIGLSNIFNVADLYPYKRSMACDTCKMQGFKVPMELPKQPPLEVECLLDTKVLKQTRRKNYYQYLVKWRIKPMEDVAWLTEVDLINMGLKVEDFPTQET